MGARYISRSGFAPGCIQVASCLIGTASDMDATDVEGEVVLATSLSTADNTTGTFPIFYIPKGTVVTNLVAQKITGTTAANLTLGDTDVDGYGGASDLLSTATGTYNMVAMLSTNSITPAYKAGRFYDSTADTYTTDNMFAINAQVTTAKLEAGKMRVYLFYFFKDELVANY